MYNKFIKNNNNDKNDITANNADNNKRCNKKGC